MRLDASAASSLRAVARYFQMVVSAIFRAQLRATYHALCCEFHIGSSGVGDCLKKPNSGFQAQDFISRKLNCHDRLYTYQHPTVLITM